MKAETLRIFLKKFDVSNSKISEYFLGKKLVTIDENVFLTNANVSNNEVFLDRLMVVKLKKLLPSTYLLTDIANNTKNVISIKSYKQALDFTYGKSLSFNYINANFKLQSGKYYIVNFYGKPLGYVELENNKLKNVMNIGEYLREY